MNSTYTNGDDLELVSVSELTRLRMAALQLESVKANRDMWRERALDAEEEANHPPPADDCQDAEDCPECGDPCYRDWPEDSEIYGEATEAANRRRLEHLEHKVLLDVDEVRELHRPREALGMRDRDSTKCPCSAASGIDEPVLTMHLGTQRPHESLVWALYNAAYSTATSDEKAAAWFADVRLEDWRSRWPEDEAA